MKKIINKLFERLGYVPKSKCEECEAVGNNIKVMDAEIKLGITKYHDFETEHNVFVTTYSDTLRKHRIIKVFRKGDTEDSADYARICARELCARELCDMLNDKY